MPPGAPRGPGSSGSRRPRRRLSRSAEFDRVYREGRSRANRHLVLYSFARSAPGEPRLGVSVGRKVGGAVERNQVKRLLREAFSSVEAELEGGTDYVIVARQAAGPLARSQGVTGFEAALRDLLLVDAADSRDPTRPRLDAG